MEGLTVIQRIREAGAEQEHQLAECRLVDMQRRLQLIEKEKHMSQIEINEGPLPAVRPAARESVVADQPEVANVVGPAFDAVSEIFGDEPGSLETPIALYGTVEESLQALHAEILARGFVPSGHCRELYVRATSEDQSDWVTELQQPVVRA